MDRTVAHYNLLDRIGESPFGQVYRARDMRYGRTVALKLIAVDTLGAMRDAFLDDARTAATLSHPNIAALFDVGEHDGDYYLAYEFATGATLAQEIGGRPVNPRRALGIAVQVADGLADAHAEGLLHTDLRPGTIIVTPKGNAKILDFGMARWTRGGTVRARAAHHPDALGADTLPIISYMSPEQAVGGLVDARTDIFSLGVIVHEMLTGTNPFAADSAADALVKITSVAAPPPSTINSDVFPDLDAIVLHALAKEIDKRQQGAALLAAQLRCVVAVLETRSGTPPPEAVLNLDDEGGTGRWWAVGLIGVAVLGAAAWWLSR
jgi:serine/threonine protein kinase